MSVTLDAYNPNDKTFKFKYFTKVKVLEKGQVFGELALLNKDKRAARIDCLEDCIFGCLDKKSYD